MTDARFEPLVTNLRAAWARAYVRIFAASREPSWILSETLLPVIGMAIRPQPVSAEATIVVWSKGSAEGYFELYTLRGKRVARSPIQFFDGSGYVGLPQNLSWMPGNLRPGVYLLRLTADDHSVSTFRWIQR